MERVGQSIAWYGIAGETSCCCCLGRVSNAPHFIVDVVPCDFQCRCNFSSHVNQLFDETLLAASIVCSNMSDDFFCIRFDHRISYLAAKKFIKLPIFSHLFESFVRLRLFFFGAHMWTRFLGSSAIKASIERRVRHVSGGVQIIARIFFLCKSCV